MTDFVDRGRVPHDEPLAIRRAVVEQLARDMNSPFVAHHRVRVDEAGITRLHDVVAVGSEPFVRVWEQSVGVAYFSLISGQDGGPDLSELASMSEPNTPEFQDQGDVPPGLIPIWDEMGVISAFSMNMFATGAYLGWLGVFQGTDAPAFEPERMERFRHRASKYIEIIAAAHVLEAARPGSSEAVIMVDSDGVVEAKGDGASAWLERPGIEQLVAAAASQAAAGETTARLVPCGAAVAHIMPLESDARRRSIIVFRPAHWPEVRTISALTRQQRLIAGHAAAGASVADIASAVGLAESTVRSHLAEIYDRLGIGSRAELTRMVARDLS